ncbi:MAG: glycosyltransferase [Acidimicrobiaceae bacterium]|nr:glycosyltransferase [Acidimicrobiaceae bacterium]
MIPLSATAVGVVIPARDEELLLGPCLQALAAAMDQTLLMGVAEVRTVVVLDCCSDRSREIARREAGRRGRQLTVIETEVGNVGRARRLGTDWLLLRFAARRAGDVWLATTDADSLVPPCWLTHQLAQRDRGIDAWAGTVVVHDWPDRPAELPAFFQAGYARHPTGHVHGASLGCRADVYLRAGGFPGIETGEDHGLWRRLGAVGARRMHDANCPVRTSGRRQGRAPHGFAAAIDELEGQL